MSFVLIAFASVAFLTGDAMADPVIIDCVDGVNNAPDGSFGSCDVDSIDFCEWGNPDAPADHVYCQSQNVFASDAGITGLLTRDDTDDSWFAVANDGTNTVCCEIIEAAAVSASIDCATTPGDCEIRGIGLHGSTVEDEIDLAANYTGGGGYNMGPLHGNANFAWYAYGDDGDDEINGSNEDDDCSLAADFPEVSDCPIVVSGDPDRCERLYGGDGSDRIRGNHGATDIIGGDGDDDTLRGGNDSDCIDAGDGADVVEAGSDDDRIAGGAGADILIGGAGDDEIYGNGGNDLICGDQGYSSTEKCDDRVTYNGVDTIYGGGGNDEIHGGARNDTLDGGLGNDTICGGGITSFGITDEDIMLGDDGVDTLIHAGTTFTSIDCGNPNPPVIALQDVTNQSSGTSNCEAVDTTLVCPFER